jgi:hypothetical protein
MQRTETQLAQTQCKRHARGPDKPMALSGLRLTLGCGEALRAQLRRSMPDPAAPGRAGREPADA